MDGWILAARAGMLTDPFGTNNITRAIVGCAIRVHAEVGPGVYENIYSNPKYKPDVAIEGVAPVRS